MIGRGLLSTRHPLLAHVIPMRRCNLACAYCNEYDDFSPPVPMEDMVRWLDKLAALGTSIITISGGEPLMHPDIEGIIARIRHHDMIAGIITNGYLLVPKKIRSLNDAGLEHLQISIDNVNPDEVSMKSLKVLEKKLEYLAEYANFEVNINSVIGGGIKNPEDALEITAIAQRLGFSTSLGIIHDGSGQVKPLDRREARVYRKIRSNGNRSYSPSGLFPGKPGQRQTQRLALPRRSPLHLCLRRRSGPLLFPTARLPRHPPGRLHERRCGTRILHKETLRPQLHRQLRPARLGNRPLARPPGTTGQHPVRPRQRNHPRPGLKPRRTKLVFDAKTQRRRVYFLLIGRLRLACPLSIDETTRMSSAFENPFVQNDCVSRSVMLGDAMKRTSAFLRLCVESNCRRENGSRPGLHPEDVVPTVDVEDLAGDSPGHGAGQEKGGVADFAGFGWFAEGGAFGVEFDHTRDARYCR